MLRKKAVFWTLPFDKGAIERACVKDHGPLFERQRNPEISDLDYFIENVKKESKRRRTTRQ